MIEVKKEIVKIKPEDEFLILLLLLCLIGVYRLKSNYDIFTVSLLGVHLVLLAVTIRKVYPIYRNVVKVAVVIITVITTYFSIGVVCLKSERDFDYLNWRAETQRQEYGIHLKNALPSGITIDKILAVGWGGDVLKLVEVTDESGIKKSIDINEPNIIELLPNKRYYFVFSFKEGNLPHGNRKILINYNVKGVKFLTMLNYP